MSHSRVKAVVLFAGIMLFLAVGAGADWQDKNVDEQEEEYIPVRTTKQKAMTPKVKGYTYSLEQLVKQVKENIKKVDEEIKELDSKKRYYEEKEAEIRDYYERGNQLYAEGRLKEAKEAWGQALVLSQEPDMQEYIRRTSVNED